MAVKYVRKGYRKGAVGLHGRGTPGVPDIKKTKQRLLMVYLGVSVLAALSLVFQLVGFGGSVAGTPVEQGEARVVGKSVIEDDTEKKRYFIDLRVEFGTSGIDQSDSGEGTPMFLDDRVVVSETAWKEFREGDTIPVFYHIDSAGEQLRILEILSEVGEE